MITHKTILAKNHPHAYISLEEGEKKRMFDTCKTYEDHVVYWEGKLRGKGVEFKKVKQSIQMKDQAGNWMNIFKIVYE